jgi:hypothetical protein
MSKINIGNQLEGAIGVPCPPANSKAVCRFKNNSGSSVSIDKFYCYWNANTTAKVKAVIYSDGGGFPNQLLGSSDERIGVISGWNQLTFSTSVIIEPNQWIWIGSISNTMLVNPHCRKAMYEVKYNTNTYTSPISQTFGTYTPSNYIYNMFVEGDDSYNRLGRTTIGDVQGNYQPNREHGEPFVLDKPILISSISTYIQTTSPTVRSKAAIYTDILGKPGVLVAQTNEILGSTSDSWMELPFSSSVNLTEGTYWLCFICSENLITVVSTAGGLVKMDGPLIIDTAFPEIPHSTFLYAIGKPAGLSIYATYT